MPEKERRTSPRIKVQKGIVALRIGGEIQTGNILDLNLTGVSFVRDTPVQVNCSWQGLDVLIMEKGEGKDVFLNGIKGKCVAVSGQKRKSLGFSSGMKRYSIKFTEMTESQRLALQNFLTKSFGS